MNIELIQGDCLEKLDELKMQGIDFDDVIFVSDPPFNVGYHYNNYKDKMSEGEYYEWLSSIFGNYAKVIIHYPESLYRFAYSVGEFPEKVVSWVYNANTPKQHRDIAFFNVVPDFTKSGQPYKNPKDKRVKKLMEQGRTARLYDWWEVQQVKNVSKEKTSHVCQMPELIMERIIEILPENKIIVDPFMGSGTTGVACKKLNRDFIGIELDQTYYEIAKKRIEDTPDKLLF